MKLALVALLVSSVAVAKPLHVMKSMRGWPCDGLCTWHKEDQLFGARDAKAPDVPLQLARIEQRIDRFKGRRSFYLQLTPVGDELARIAATMTTDDALAPELYRLVAKAYALVSDDQQRALDLRRSEGTYVCSMEEQTFHGEALVHATSCYRLARDHHDLDEMARCAVLLEVLAPGEWPRLTEIYARDVSWQPALVAVSSP